MIRRGLSSRRIAERKLELIAAERDALAKSFEHANALVKQGNELLEEAGAIMKELAAERDALASENSLFRAALEDVADPLVKMVKQAKEEGNVLSDMAFAIAHDLNFVQNIARNALRDCQRTVKDEQS